MFRPIACPLHRVAAAAFAALLAASIFSPRGAPALSREPRDPRGGAAEPPAEFESPRLDRLARECRDRGNRADALASFWQEVRGRAPLVEPAPGTTNEVLVTFPWQGTPQTRRVGPLGTKPSPDPSENEFKRFLDTDLWYKTERLPADARFGYAIAENGGPYKPDPLNPRTFAGRSVVELPNAPKEPWLARDPAVAAGTLTTPILHSDVLKEDRSVAVYLPAGHRAGAADPYPLLVVFDGESFGSRSESAIQTRTILDNLSAAKKIRPTVAVLVNSQGTRDRDLVCSEAFSDFLALELVPWCRREFNVSPDPAQTTAAGSSYGGLCAAYAAFRRPTVFGNVLSMSGSFSYFPGWQAKKPENADETGWLTRQLATGPKLPVRFCLSVGRFESNLLRENRRLRDVLEAKGYRLDYFEYSGGHDYLGWRYAFVDGLVKLLAPTPAPGR